MQTLIKTLSRTLNSERSSTVRHLSNQRGQTATEYMLIIAVVVLGLVGSASYFIPKFKTGTEALADSVNSTMKNSACGNDSRITPNTTGATADGC